LIWNGWSGVKDSERLTFRLQTKPDNSGMTLSLIQQRTQKEYSLTLPVHDYWIHAVVSGGGETVELSLDGDPPAA